MNTSAFRDDIWQVLHEAWADDEPLPMHADAVLLMPEMEAIRVALRRMAMDINDLEYTLRFYGLPESVIDWVSDEPASRTTQAPNPWCG